jgi:hypothetical protein
MLLAASSAPTPGHSGICFLVLAASAGIASAMHATGRVPNVESALGRGGNCVNDMLVVPTAFPEVAPSHLPEGRCEGCLQCSCLDHIVCRCQHDLPSPGRSTATVGTRYLQARPRSSLRIILLAATTLGRDYSVIVIIGVCAWSSQHVLHVVLVLYHMQMRRTCASYFAVRSIANML